MKEFGIENFINELTWSKDATDHEKTLVAGNLRNLYSVLSPKIIELQKALVKAKSEILASTESHFDSMGKKYLAKQHIEYWKPTEYIDKVLENTKLQEDENGY